MIYFDANASEPLRPEARAAALAAMDIGGNPSSIHASGRAVRKILENARESLAARFAARPRDIVFTSGATEANALAIHALGSGRTIVMGATEHDAIRAAAPEAAKIIVRPDGQFIPAALEAQLVAHPGALVCLMAANNETGVRHDIAAAAKICAAHGALLHIDAAQAAGRCLDDWLTMGAAAFAVSGHKAGGPLGAGALIFAPAYGALVAPVQKGGGQERGWRGGTPALPAIAGMAAALAAPYDAANIQALRDDIAAFCQDQGAEIAGLAAPRLPNTLCLILPGVRADTQLIALDMDGIAVSAGSACSSGKLAASHVLDAMGYGAQAGQAIRVSLPWNVTAAQVETFKKAYAAMAARALRGRQVAPTEARIAV